MYVHYVRLRPFVEFLAIYHLCHSPSSCGESVLQPGGGGRDAAPAPEAPLHPRPHHGPRRLRHHVLPGDHCRQLIIIILVLGNYKENDLATARAVHLDSDENNRRQFTRC